MADESPEQVRERIHAEELAKGSDPRVAEGRAKAAEMRAKLGLPIEPEQAWKAKLEQEGGTPAATDQDDRAAAEPEAPEPAGTEQAAEAPAEQVEAPVEQVEAPVSEAPAEQAPEQEPAAEPVPAPAAVQPEPPAAVTAAPTEPVPEPEVGEPIAWETDDLDEIAGIKLRDPRVPTAILLVLLAIALWAASYVVFLSGPEASQDATSCRVEPDRSLVCFEEQPSSRGGPEVANEGEPAQP